MFNFLRKLSNKRPANDDDAIEVMKEQLFGAEAAVDAVGIVDYDIEIFQILRVLFRSARAFGSISRALQDPEWAKALEGLAQGGTFHQHAQGMQYIYYPAAALSVGANDRTCIIQIVGANALILQKVAVEEAAQVELEHRDLTEDDWTTTDDGKLFEFEFPQEPRIVIATHVKETDVDPFLSGSFKPGVLIKLQLINKQFAKTAQT